MIPTNPDVIVGLEKADDAGVYRVTDQIALIQTVDFFTPIVDDPYAFGQIAAANALSDIYAMGGVPKTAMNLVAFPLKTMEMAILRAILEGGIDKMKEADVALVGGHSIEDSELKYGLSVTGFVHPERVLTKSNLKPGDRLVLTKPLGTGILTTAIKAGIVSEAIISKITDLMARLNRTAAEVMANYNVHACTDITGFGLIGHLSEMVIGSKMSVEIDASAVPLIEGAIENAEMGMIPAGAYKNREFREKMVVTEPSVRRAIEDILYDPQTSGGLLIAVEGDQAPALCDALLKRGADAAALIGQVVENEAEKIFIR